MGKGYSVPMADQSLGKKIVEDSTAEVIAKLMEAGLLPAAAAFGAHLDPKETAALAVSTCSVKDFCKKVLLLAEITGDNLLAENLRKRSKCHDLKYSLSPTALSISEIYAERFYSYWQDGKQLFIRTEISDLPQWYNTTCEKADAVFDAAVLENVLVMSCAKERASKAPLLKKLIDNVVSSETIRLGYLYPDRETAIRIFEDFCQKMKDLLLIRELHGSSLQLGEHPEEFIPYVWSNILKNLLNHKLVEAFDNINALAYLHYAAEKTESLIGTAAYAELKKGLLLFDGGKQCTWPNEIRRMFLNPTLVEALMRYRFAHGLIAINTALAFRLAEEQRDAGLDPRDEDAVVLNGLSLTRSGYIRSPGFKDVAVREEFVRNLNYFKSIRKTFESHTRDSFFSWHNKMKSDCELLEAQLRSGMRIIDRLLAEGNQAIQSKQDRDIDPVPTAGRKNSSFLKRLWKPTDPLGYPAQPAPEMSCADPAQGQRDLEDLETIKRIYEQTVLLLRQVYGLFN